MRLLIISDAWYPQINGVVRTYEHIGAQMRSFGHEVKVVGPCDFKWRVPMPGYAEIQLVVAPGRTLKKIIEDYAPDRIHISTEGPLGWAARRYCLRHGVAFSSAFHTQFPDYVAARMATMVPALSGVAHQWAKGFVRRFHKPSNVIMVATDSLVAKLKSWGFEAKMHRVVRGAELALFRPLAVGEERPLYAGLEGPIALYVGRIAIEKSVEDFLEMEWNGAKVIVGDGPERAWLERAFPDVLFTGMQTGEDLAAYYRQADVFVFPSRTDTFGMVIIEALASGLPVAAYDVSGPQDIVVADHLGALDKNNLAIAAQKALGCGSAVERAAYVKAHYTWERAARQYEQGLLKAGSQKD